MKPIICKLRRRLCVNYLDDFLIFGETAAICASNTRKLVNILESLGFIINNEKSNLSPSTKRAFLGVIFDSSTMTLSLLSEKKERIKERKKAGPHSLQQNLAAKLALWLGLLVF